jgi:translation initiation factor 2 subunit 3
VEIRPGLIIRSATGEFECRPLTTKITSIKTDVEELSSATPGGLVALCTKLDPCLTRRDRLVGQILGYPGTLPPVYIQIQCEYNLIKGKHFKPALREMLLLNISSKSIAGVIIKRGTNSIEIELSSPVCTNVGQKFTISTRVQSSWKLCSFGTVSGGKKLI